MDQVQTDYEMISKIGGYYRSSGHNGIILVYPFFSFSEGRMSAPVGIYLPNRALERGYIEISEDFNPFDSFRGKLEKITDTEAAENLETFGFTEIANDIRNPPVLILNRN